MADQIPNQRFKAPLQMSNVTGCAEVALHECESRLGVRMPPELRRFYLKHNGGYPRPDGYTLRSGFTVVIRIYAVEACRCSNVPGLLEFGDSIFGDHYAVSCRRMDNGSIYWIDHETCDPDSLSIRSLSMFRWLPLSIGAGIVKIADSFEELISNMHFSRGDWISHLLGKSSEEFRAFAQEVSFDFKDEIGTPLISMVASHGSMDDFRFVDEHTSSYPADIVCQAVRNTRDSAAIADYLLSRGANGEHSYYEGKPYPMGYAKAHGLTDIIEVLKRHNIPDLPGLI